MRCKLYDSKNFMCDTVSNENKTPLVNSNFFFCSRANAGLRQAFTKRQNERSLFNDSVFRQMSTSQYCRITDE